MTTRSLDPERGEAPLVVPTAFAEATIAREGEPGRRWIAALPETVERFCRRWDLTPRGRPRHGYVGVVVPVTRGGEPLALKIGWVDDSSRHEALALRAWSGNGAAHLVDAEPEAGALLLEWLDPDRSLLSLSGDAAARVAGELLRRLAVPAPAGLPTLEQEASEIRRTMRAGWLGAGRPFRERFLDLAIEIAHPDPTEDGPIVNRDLHYENVLAGSREPWLVIDPKPLAGPIEFGVAQLLWNRFDELPDARALRRRIDVIAEAADLDRRGAVRWSLFRVLEYWIWALEEGLTEDPERCRQLADWLEVEVGRGRGQADSTAGKPATERHSPLSE